MLKWKVSTNKKKLTSFRGEAPSSGNADDLDAALVELWVKVLDELDARLKEGEWEILICQFVTHNGALIVYPAKKISGESDDAKFIVEIRVDAWKEAYEALPDPDDELVFEKGYDRLLSTQLRAIKNAMNDERVKTRFAALKRLRSFAIFHVDEGETPVRDRMEFMWGNRPPKRNYTTAKELFEHIFRKAELEPASSMRLRDDKVVAVNWFGHEFTDKFVDLMAEVPNVGSLCADLKEYFLVATRLKPASVERLQRLLPHTRFTLVTDEEFANGIDPWRD